MRQILGLCGACIVLGTPATVSANPIPSHHEVFMASEELAVAMDGNQATLVGHFVFRSASHMATHRPSEKVYLEIPIWIPSQPSQTGGDLARFLDVLSAETRFFIPRGEHPSLVDSLFGLRVRVNGEPIHYQTVSWKQTGSPGLPNGQTFPPILRLNFHYFLDPEIFTDDADLSVRYRQPLIQNGTTSWFFYRPMLTNLPPGAWSEHPEKYRIHLITSEPAHLQALSELRFHADPKPNELLILPEHGRPIVVELRGSGNRALGPTLYRNPGWSAQERQWFFLSKGHIVASGDTLTHLAGRYGIRVNDLLAMNPDLDPRRLKIGMVVRIRE